MSSRQGARTVSGDRGSRDSETVVGVFELWRNTRSRGSASNLDVVSPGATSRGSATGVGRPLRISSFGRAGHSSPRCTSRRTIRARCRPDCRARKRLADTHPPAQDHSSNAGCSREAAREACLPLRVECTLGAAASRALPLGFARQAIGLGSGATQPLAKLHSLMPRYRDDGHLRLIEIWIVPAKRLRTPHCGKKAGVLLVRDLVSGKLRRYPPRRDAEAFSSSRPISQPIQNQPPGTRTITGSLASIRAVREAAMHGLSIRAFTCNWVRTSYQDTIRCSNAASKV